MEYENTMECEKLKESGSLGTEKEAEESPEKGGTCIFTLHFNSGFEDGALIVSDSRETSEENGQIIVENDYVPKLVSVDETNPVVVAGAGDAHGIDTMVDWLQRYTRVDSPSQAADVLGYYIRHTQNWEGFQASFLVSGYTRQRGVRTFHVSRKGIVEEQDGLVGIGSGSEYVTEFVPNGYNYNMSINTAVEFARQAISNAVHQDCRTGGVLHMIYIGANPVNFPDIYMADLCAHYGYPLPRVFYR